MPKQKQTAAQRARLLLLRGEIKTLEALLLIIKPTPFAQGVGTSPKRFGKLLADLSLFSFADIKNIAEFLDVDEEIIHKMVWDEYKKSRKRR